MKKIKWIITVFIIWRLLLFIPLVFGQLFIPERTGFQYTDISDFFLSSWANFDGVHYLNIASRGYLTEARFFPLYPIIIHLISPILGHFFSAFLISNISFLLALIVLYKLIRLDYPDKLAKWTIIFLLVSPASFFLGAVYSESLFLLLAVLSFYLARKRNWFFAGAIGFLLTLTRPVGIIILPVLLWEFFVIENKRLKIISLFLIPLGILTYAWFNLQKWGNALYFIHAQGQLANSRTVTSIILPPQTIFRYAKILTTVSATTFEWWVALLELSVFIFTFFLLYLVWKKKIRFSYLLLAALGLLIPSLTGTFSGLPRYVIVLFPFFLAMALIKNRIFKIVYILLSAFLLFILLAFFSQGYFVA